VGDQEDDSDVPILAVLEELFRVMRPQSVHEEHDLSGVLSSVRRPSTAGKMTRSAQTSNRRDVMRVLAWVTIVTLDALYA
jgi:hypothetical protein